MVGKTARSSLPGAAGGAGGATRTPTSWAWARVGTRMAASRRLVRMRASVLSLKLKTSSRRAACVLIDANSRSLHSARSGRDDKSCHKLQRRETKLVVENSVGKFCTD